MGCLKELIMALLEKQLWRFLVEGGSLWHSIISCRYSLDLNGVDCNSHSSRSMSLIWKNVIKIFPLFSPNTRFMIGNGRLIKFWKDLWWDDHPLSYVFPCLFHISMYKDTLVADVLSPSFNELNWNLPFSRDLFEWEVELLANLFSSLNGVFISNIILDKRVWTLESSGQLTSKSFFILILNVSSPSYSFPFKRIWSPPVPPRVRI